MVTAALRTSDFDYVLPNDLIAQHPTAQRDGSRLMVLDRKTESIHHASINELDVFLQAPDVLVVNRSRVIRARLRLTRPNGGSAELLLLRPLGDGRWCALGRPARKFEPGMQLLVPGSVFAVTLDRPVGEGQWEIRLPSDLADSDFLQRFGEMPLPPYIRDHTTSDDRYQTIYGDRDGSVAAPTAGLHFTSDLLQRITAKGVDVQHVTLHVGAGTFKPVTVDDVEKHVMHAEWGEVPGTVATAINAARERGGRLVSVGTTTTRVLETASDANGTHAWKGETSAFFYPGYRFQVVDVLLTNFHLPRSTLLMLVSAFAGREFVLHAYAQAVRERYRFFSFGDAMLIL